MRVQKLKTNTSVRGSLKHAFRDIETPNADSEKLGENSHVGADSQESAMKAYKDLLPDKIRKNGVRCLEYLMTASPEKMQEMNREEQDAYFTDCRKWLEKMHGKEQVFYSGVHRDETTPHMYAYVVPLSQEKDQEGNLIKPGKLNAREFIGGSSRRMSELQDEFAEEIGEPHGLERGLKGSKAKHERVKRHYGKVEQGFILAQEIAQKKEWKEQEEGKGFFKKVGAKVVNAVTTNTETDEHRARRLADAVVKERSTVRELDTKVRRQKWDNESLSRSLSYRESELKEYEDVKELGYSDKKRVLELAKDLRREAEEKERADKEREKLARIEAQKERARNRSKQRDSGDYER